MRGRMRALCTSAAVAVVAVAGPLALAGPAAGETTLESATAITPPAGWVLAPAAETDAQVAQQAPIVAGAQHLTYTFASKEWTQPNSTNQLTVTLWAYATQDISRVEATVKAEKPTCPSGETATTTTAAGIAGSKETVCASPSAGSHASTYGFTEIGWFTADVYASVRAIGVPTAQLATDAHQVAEAIPAGGVPATPGGSSNRSLYVAGFAVVVIGAAALLVLHRRRAGQGGAAVPVYQSAGSSGSSWNPAPAPAVTPSDTAPAVAPGWHPLPGDPTKTAYWDGTQWAAYRQWDGQQWVDAAAAHR
jgi:hypothetical protein